MRPAQFVSKVEVRSWPIVGWLASKTGTLFIDRTKRHDTARVNNELAAILSGGGCVAVFPEGTTSDGTMLRHFHASLLQPAVQSQSQIWPVAIRYTQSDGTPNMAPAYVDDLTFADSLILILSQAVIYAEVQYLPPIDAHGKTRRELAYESHRAIARALDLSDHHHRSA
jgi:1-acyl-sn-glycerol-3-phosphate acyltransferase